MSRRSIAPEPRLWGSLADVREMEASPVMAATTLARIFGSGASAIAAWCALYTRLEGEMERYDLWLNAFKHLQATALPRHG